MNLLHSPLLSSFAFFSLKRKFFPLNFDQEKSSPEKRFEDNLMQFCSRTRKKTTQQLRNYVCFNGFFMLTGIEKRKIAD